MSRNMFFKLGMRYAGSSRTNGTGFPLNMVSFKSSAEVTATAKPSRYRNIMTSAPYLGKNAAVNSAYTGIFAEQDMNGMMKMVIFLSRLLVSVRVDMIAGTEQPKPMSIGTKLLPLKPILRSMVSMTNAMRAM